MTRAVFLHPERSHIVLRRSIFAILDDSALCSIATVSQGHRPHINTAFYSYDSTLRLFFLSDPGTRHARNIETCPSVGVTIFDSHQRWGGPLRGLQLFGSCKVVRGFALRVAAERSYGARFPAYRRWMGGLSAEEQRALRSVYYAFTPGHLTLFDERTFGEEVFLEVVIRRRNG